MRRRFSFICVYVCLLALFCLGAGELLFLDRGERISVTENRVLQPLPALTAESVRTGRFMDQFEDYLSDGFFFRDEAAAFHDGCMALFALPEEGPDTGVVADEQLWEGNDTEPEPEQTAEEALPPPESEAVSPAPGEPEDAARVPDASLWLVREDGSRETVFTYSGKALASFADILNRLRELLPEDGRVFFANPQVSAVANNVILKQKYVGWGSDLEDVMQPLAAEGVTVIDCTDVLAPYMEDRVLYPVEDYHWHAAAACIVVNDLMSRQGLPTADYDQYRYWLSFKHNNKAYTVDALRGMRYGRDAIEIMAPISPAKSYILTDLTRRREVAFTMSEGGYVGFLQGHKGPWRLILGGFHTGRSALIIGDCFIPPMVPYLAAYYDTIVTTDVRDNFYKQGSAGGGIRQYIEEYGVDDVYVIYSTNSRFESEGLQSRLRRYMDSEHPG
ncbi:MAG: hypothetical protein K5990_03625 [Oscillospiraceae bacterium]|nr:hypothetical protein [Oscillospiraceae bacterium]